MQNWLISKKVQNAVEISVSLFGLYMLYQILRRMLGGSWGIEALIFGLVVLHIGFTFGLAMKMAETKTDLRHLNKKFYALATDFKELRNKFSDQTIEFKAQRKEFSDLAKKVDLSLKKRK